MAAIDKTLTEDFVRAIALLIALGLLGYQVVVVKQISSEVVSIVSLILGYYFGRGVTNGQTHA